MRFATFFAAVLLLTSSASAQTADEEYTRSRFDALVGKTMGQIMNESGRFPVNMYEDDKGRNFVFEFGQCSAMLKTKQVNKRATADSWVVYGYSARGWCGALF